MIKSARKKNTPSPSIHHLPYRLSVTISHFSSTAITAFKNNTSPHSPFVYRFRPPFVSLTEPRSLFLSPILHLFLLRPIIIRLPFRLVSGTTRRFIILTKLQGIEREFINIRRTKNNSRSKYLQVAIFTAEVWVQSKIDVIKQHHLV